MPKAPFSVAKAVIVMAYRVKAWTLPASTLRILPVDFDERLTAECLSLIGAAGDTIVEGPFAGNDAYLRMLGATGRRVLRSPGRTGTSLGAAMLVPGPVPPAPLAAVAETSMTGAMRRYAADWRARLSAMSA